MQAGTYLPGGLNAHLEATVGRRHKRVELGPQQHILLGAVLEVQHQRRRVTLTLGALEQAANDLRWVQGEGR